MLSRGNVASVPLTWIVLRVWFSSSSKRLSIVWQGSCWGVRRRPALRVASGERVALATGSVLERGLSSWKSSSAHA